MAGTIATMGDTVIYTFAGEAGDVVTLSLWTTAATDAGFSAVADVYGPDGSVVASSVRGLADLGPLTASGTYTLRVRDYSDAWNAAAARAVRAGTALAGAGGASVRGDGADVRDAGGGHDRDAGRHGRSTRLRARSGTW